MARSDLIVELVKAGSQSDQRLLRRTVEELAAEERAKQHHVLADRLLAQLSSNGGSAWRRSTLAPDKGTGAFIEINPRLALSDLILPDAVRTAIEEVVEEQHRSDVLRSYNLEPRHRILLAGPPGNGKTSLAEAIAEALMLPLIVVRYDVIIGSFLGETATRLRGLFDEARTRRCVLFFDEFDALGKERGDIHETGEIKRVVSSLLLQIDDLPSYTVVVTATNHPELLDRAVWRRFQLRLELPSPTVHQTEEWVARFASRLNAPLGIARKSLVAKLKGLSFSELDEFGADVQRRYVLALPTGDLKKIVESQLRQLAARFEAPSEEEGQVTGGMGGN